MGGIWGDGGGDTHPPPRLGFVGEGCVGWGRFSCPPANPSLFRVDAALFDTSSAVGGTAGTPLRKPSLNEDYPQDLIFIRKRNGISIGFMFFSWEFRGAGFLGAFLGTKRLLYSKLIFKIEA